MKLYCLQVLYKNGDGKVNPLSASHELSSFGYFQRSSVQEFMDFTSKIITERTMIASRASVKEQDYICHVYVRSDGLSGVVIGDHEYPKRVAHTLLNKILDTFETQVPNKSEWSKPNSGLKLPYLSEHLAKYQDPKQADAMTKIQSELDETKIILHNTIEALLERDEKLDALVDRSADLSVQSKAFYKTARKTNSCCVIL
ncbi:synaptobrevin homolog YKT6-like [Argopecten irradians]|uniref:synaptobrevin homolog YKT6-like n=1 Tax=Argopecten irradians TaxID=31199 RepID=UPI00371A31B7